MKNLLDEMADVFPNNAHLDSFRHSSMLSGKDVKKIKNKYSFPSWIKVREVAINDMICNWDPKWLCIFKGALDAG